MSCPHGKSAVWCRPCQIEAERLGTPAVPRRGDGHGSASRSIRTTELLDTTRSFVSQFKGRCAVCESWFPTGTLIRRTSTGYRHARKECAE